MPEKKEQKLPKRVEIKFDDLSPMIQNLINGDSPIKSPLIGHRYTNLKKIRRNKFISKISGIIGAGMFAYALIKPGAQEGLSFVGGAMQGFGWTNRFIEFVFLKNLHKQLAQNMKHGVFVPSAEKHYPDGWINPSIVGKTHPIFFVKGNGNIVFVKPTHDEYFRWKYQQHKVLGGLGLVAWRWRQEIAPPVVPVKVREWAKVRIAKIAEKARELIPQPMPRPIPVGVYSKRKKEKRTRLRPAFA
ncbi:MAG: hypothetical protein Q7S21_02775 [archaeon]|nr:hypothetical protein [archaeon]